MATRDGSKTKFVKQIIGMPLRGEHERAAAYYGTVFGLKAVALHTFGISDGVSGERTNGLSFRTYPGGAEEPVKPGVYHLLCAIHFVDVFQFLCSGA